jgi:DNA-binding HxlR family transcriptional regulator
VKSFDFEFFVGGSQTMESNLQPISTIFVGRWTVNILLCLQERPHRHTELRRCLENVSQRMLTRNLRNLESTGLISRREIKSKVMGVEYSLTELGKTFIRPLTQHVSLGQAAQ